MGFLGQRGLLALIVGVVLIVGILAGGALPNEFGSVLTVKTWLGFIAPVLLTFVIMVASFNTINTAVRYRNLAAGSAPDILRRREFWATIIAAIVMTVQLFTDIEIIGEDRQALLVDAILIIVALLLRTWDERPPAQAES